jgi:hypothetical protein
MNYARRAAAYREKAEEMRTLADGMTTTGAAKTFLLMASDYLDMAKMLDRWNGDGGDPEFKL